MLLRLCDLCKQSSCRFQCPNYKPAVPIYYCSYCGEGIYNGEEYIESLSGEYCHYDCIHGIRDLLEWLGHEVKIMEDNY